MPSLAVYGDQDDGDWRSLQNADYVDISGIDRYLLFMFIV